MNELHTINGEKITIAEAIRKYGGKGVNYNTFKHRFYDRMWGFEESITLPNVGQGGGPHPDRKHVRKKKKELTEKQKAILDDYLNSSLSVYQIARKHKCDHTYPSTLARRRGLARRSYLANKRDKEARLTAP